MSVAAKGLPMSAWGHSRLRWSRPRLVRVRFNSDSDRQPSKRDPPLRARHGHQRVQRKLCARACQLADYEDVWHLFALVIAVHQI